MFRFHQELRQYMRRLQVSKDSDAGPSAPEPAGSGSALTQLHCLFIGSIVQTVICHHLSSCEYRK